MTLRPALPDYKPRPGDIILVPFAGPIGWLITLLQAVVAGDPSRYSHAAVVIDSEWAVQATFPRAEIAPLSELLARRPCAVLVVPPDADYLRPRIVEAALGMVGVRYQFAAYLYIGLAKLRIRPRWLLRLLASRAALICSALADRAWADAGLHCFTDGRPFGAVTPGDLAHVGWTRHMSPGPWLEDFADEVDERGLPAVA
jgi:hypothetical protein